MEKPKRILDTAGNPNANKYFSMMDGPKNSEALLQKQVCQWLRLQYPGILFESGMQGFKLSIKDAVFASVINSHRGMPDLKIYEPRGLYVGLAIELKKKGEMVIRKDGQLSKDEHIQEQAEVLRLLDARGWYVRFCIGFEEAQQTINWYLNQ